MVLKIIIVQFLIFFFFALEIYDSGIRAKAALFPCVRAEIAVRFNGYCMSACSIGPGPQNGPFREKKTRFRTTV